MEFQDVCANWSENTTCTKAGKYACKNCQLLTYCGPECQKSHWTTHKVDCKSSLGNSTWEPDWVLENRAPAFVGDGSPQAAFGGLKYLWGNVPAFDIIQLGANEGTGYDGEIRLLFAASGDLRNVVKTIVQLPDSFKQAISVTINDRDLDVVARNVILLFISLIVDDIDEAAQCTIHVWYSALIRQSDLDILQGKIRPIIEDVCHNTKGKPGTTLLAKTWTFRDRSLRVVLQKSAWDAILNYMDTSEALTADRAIDIRKAVTLAPQRKDYRDRHLLFQAHSHRVALTRFQEDGLLLPFGAPRGDFQRPNPTLFHTSQWSMPDNADPLTGWPLHEVHKTSSGPAKADIYGRFFAYIRTVITAYLNRLSCSKVSFTMHHVDALTLPNYLSRDSYSRIEVSNIADAGYLGIQKTLNSMVPLLQRPLDNPHATLITLFMNAVDENITEAERKATINPRGPTMKQVVQYLPLTLRGLGPNGTIVFKFLAARDCIAKHESTFDRYMKIFQFARAAELAEAAMKTKHTVIEKWPFRLKLRPGMHGAQEEFDRLFSSGISSKECYLEWKTI